MADVFTPELKKKADDLVAKYESRRASLLELLRLFMEQKGHITREDEAGIAQYLGIPAIDVREVMTFYTLFYEKPRAKNRYHVCRTLACSLLGAKDIVKRFEERLGIKAGQTSSDGKYSLNVVECLGACELAPMMQVNDCDFVGHLTRQKVDEMVRKAE